MRSKLFLCILLVTLSSVSIVNVSPSASGAFEDDVQFLRKHTEIIVLSASEQGARVALAPAWQGRVMTSAVAGERSLGFGWINHALIDSGKVQPQINAFGGEDRLWLGPEGSQFSIYFAEGAPFHGDHWFVPKPLDTLPFTVVSQSRMEARLHSEFALKNRSGTSFQIAVEREVRLIEEASAWQHMEVAPSKGIGLVAYQSTNKLVNASRQPWKKETGLLSIWILGMFNASAATTVVVPLRTGSEAELGAKVTTYEAYGPIPNERLKATDRAIFFRGDAKRRGKIGISPRRSLGKLGSYDAGRRTLTIVQFTQPQGMHDYVNSLWGVQPEPYGGDAINSYNDGAPAPGQQALGNFFELESSSPAAALAPGDYLEHTHRTIHLTGPEVELDRVAKAVLGVSLAEIAAAFPSA